MRDLFMHELILLFIILHVSTLQYQNLMVFQPCYQHQVKREVPQVLGALLAFPVLLLLYFEPQVIAHENHHIQVSFCLLQDFFYLDHLHPHHELQDFSFLIPQLLPFHGEMLLHV
jgi:hypothetical protein